MLRTIIKSELYAVLVLAAIFSLVYLLADREAANVNPSSVAFALSFGAALFGFIGFGLGQMFKALEVPSLFMIGTGFAALIIADVIFEFPISKVFFLAIFFSGYVFTVYYCARRILIRMEPDEIPRPMPPVYMGDVVLAMKSLTGIVLFTVGNATGLLVLLRYL